MSVTHPDGWKAVLAVLLLAAVIAAPAVSLPSAPRPDPAAELQDDEIVKEFRRYYKKYKDSGTRVEAILALEGTETTSVVDVLLPILKSEDPEVLRAAVRVLAGFKGQPPIARLIEALEKEKNEAIRIGILRAFADGGYKGTTSALIVCLSDKSWDVRRRALEALAATGDERGAEWMRPLCEDAETAVRCAALDGLAELRAEGVIEPALADLDHETWQVRASAIHALTRVRTKEAVQPLIDRLEVEEGRLGIDIAIALGDITGRNFGQRVELWKKFWGNVGERFVIPTDAELRKLREAQKKSAEKYKPSGGTSYHGIETPSRSIIFVIDVSGSMENLVVEKERFRDGGYPSFARIDIVKTELVRTIENLEPYVEFNILAFATEVKSWKKQQVRANVLNKSSASSFVRRLKALGGSSKEDLARVGLTGTANLEAGKTNTYGALVQALGAAGQGIKDKNYEVAVDTVFFLSDGRPSTGEYVDTDDILREIAESNKLRKVVIHTIAIGEFQKHFMRALAEHNGGVFVDLGR